MTSVEGFTTVRREVHITQASEEAHEEMLMRRLDWRHVCEDLGAVDLPRIWPDRVASASVGLAVAALLAGLAESQTHTAGALSWAWLQTAYFVAAGAAAVIAVLLWIVDSGDRSKFRKDVDTVKERMKEIEALFPPTPADKQIAAVIAGATYGANGTTIDVIDDLTALMADGKLGVVVANELFGIPHRVADPAFQIVKTLTVEYRHGGQTKVKTVAEGAWLELP